MKKVTALSLSSTGLDLIKSFEGCKLTAYRDVKGVATIGYGHTFGVKMGMTITQAQADEFLKADIKHFEEGVNVLLNELGVQVTQCQFDALVSLAFNIGLRALAKSTLAKYLYTMRQDDQESIYKVADQFLRWKFSGGKEYPGLLNRRKKERLHFLLDAKV
ncbi:lysozyme [Mannheimia sp. E30BD]|uniref:lysozyme n=1 Tax=Mannheimia sp. E30BD TaxID=3278708 RepID=UPI00359EFD14